MKYLARLLPLLLLGVSIWFIAAPDVVPVQPLAGDTGAAGGAEPVETRDPSDARRLVAVPDGGGEEVSPEVQAAIDAIAAVPAIARTFTGRVVDAGGSPVAGAELRCFVRGAGADRPAATARTDGRGAFSLGGEFRRGAPVWIGVRAPDHAARVVLVAEAGRALGDIVLEPAGVLAGRVVDHRNIPVEEARVRYRVADDRPGAGDLEQWLGPVKTQAGGYFELAAVPAGRFTLEVTPVGYPADATAARQLAAGARLDLGDVTVELGLELRGVVTDAAGAPIAGARVAARRALPPGIDALASPEAIRAQRGGVALQPEDAGGTLRLVHATTDANGRFVLRGVTGAKLCVTAEHEDFVQAVRDGVDPARTQELTLSMAPRITVTGRVVDARSGAPIARFGIRARRSDDGSGPPGPTPAPKAHADGRFEVRVARSGEHVFDVDAPGFGKVAAGPFAVGADGARDVIVRVEPGVELAGRVVLADTGLPVVGAEVQLHRAELRPRAGDDVDFRALFLDREAPVPGAGRVASVRTREDGTFTFGLQRPGRFRVVATGQDTGRTTVDDVVLRAGSPVRDLRVALGAGGRITGRVQGAPAGAHVEVRRPGARSVTVPVAADGGYEAPGLDAGSYWIGLRAAGAPATALDRLAAFSRAPDVELRAGAVVRFDFDAAGRSGAVRGSVEVNGAAAPGVQVSLHEVGDVRGDRAAVAFVRSLQAQPGPDGTFALEAVPAGRYRLEVRNGGGLLEQREITVGRGQDPAQTFRVATGDLALSLRHGAEAASVQAGVRLVQQHEGAGREPETWDVLPSLRQAQAADGKVALRGLPAGAWLFEVSTAEGERRRGTVHVAPGGAQRWDVDVAPERVTRRSVAGRPGG